MQIASADIPNTILAVGGFITAVGGFALNVWMTMRQTKILKAHSDDNREQIKNTVTAASGTYKAPPPELQR